MQAERQRILGAWQGRVSGCQLGKPVELLSMQQGRAALDDYLSRPMLVDPLRVEDCCLISDGGGAYIMTTPERARDLAKPGVVVAGVVIVMVLMILFASQMM